MGNSVDGLQEDQENPAKPVTRNTLKHPLAPQDVFDTTPEPPNPPKGVHSGTLSIEGGIVEVPADALRPTLLWRLLKTGARAIRVMGEPALPQLWRNLMPESESDRETSLGEILPWAASLETVSRNYHPAPCVGQMIGDLFYARPPVLTYFARKMVVYPRDGASDLVLEPGVLHQDGGPFRLPASVARAAWELGTRLLETLSAPNWRLERPTLALERLMYASSLQDLRRRIEMVRNALGPWAQYGHRFDELCMDTARPFQRKFLREALAFGRMLPKVGSMLERVNRYAARMRPQDVIPAGMHLAGEPHTDYRLFSMLSSRRTGIRTELLAEDGSWRELPMSPDSLVIIPGVLARQALGLEPTVHRVLFTSEGEAGGMNATLLLGLAPRVDG